MSFGVVRPIVLCRCKRFGIVLTLRIMRYSHSCHDALCLTRRVNLCAPRQWKYNVSSVRNKGSAAVNYEFTVVAYALLIVYHCKTAGEVLCSFGVFFYLSVPCLSLDAVIQYSAADGFYFVIHRSIFILRLVSIGFCAVLAEYCCCVFIGWLVSVRFCAVFTVYNGRIFILRLIAIRFCCI